jgi:hypothetical protein
VFAFGVMIYLPGSKTPIYPNVSVDSVAGIAFDSLSNLYISGETNNVGEVAEATQASGYQESSTILSGVDVGPLAIDPSGDAIICTSASCSIYPPGKTTPSFVLATKSGGVETFALEAKGDFLYTVTGSGFLILRYPSGTPYEQFSAINNSIPSTALDPPASPGPPWPSNAWRRR